MSEPATKSHPSFDERCKQESTQNVVFLFQTARWIHTGFPMAEDGEYCHDGEGIRLGDTDDRGYWAPRGDAEYLTREQLEEMDNADGCPCVVKVWDTKFVTLRRDEGDNHGKEFGYRYRDGWRVYGVPALGAMVELIRNT